MKALVPGCSPPGFATITGGAFFEGSEADFGDPVDFSVILGDWLTLINYFPPLYSQTCIRRNNFTLLFEPYKIELELISI
jgi:hypothetical protein